MHNYPCDWKSGFVMDPNKKQRVGYLVTFQGLDMGERLDADVTVFTPYNSAAALQYKGDMAIDENKRIKVVGVIDSFSYNGGVGDPICISAYISAENAATIKGKLQTTLKTTIIKSLSWWIVDFDEENKAWYEQAFPLDPAIVKAQLNAPGGKDIRLQVSDDPTKIAANIDVNVYNIYFEVVPAANDTYVLGFASSSKTPYARNWGLKVGTKAAEAMQGA
jgi:hypothetical protein